MRDPRKRKGPGPEGHWPQNRGARNRKCKLSHSHGPSRHGLSLDKSSDTQRTSYYSIFAADCVLTLRRGHRFSRAFHDDKRQNVCAALWSTRTYVAAVARNHTFHNSTHSKQRTAGNTTAWILPFDSKTTLHAPHTAAPRGRNIRQDCTTCMPYSGRRSPR